MASIEHDLFIGEWQAIPTKVMLVLKDYNYSSQADRHRPLDRFNLKDREAGYRVYQMDYSDYEFYDTLCVSRRVLPNLENHQLQTVAAACGFNMKNHHHALADAEACAWIAREIL